MLELFGPALAPIGRRVREFGLAYTAAQLIHVCLVVWLFQISSSPLLSGKLFEFFVIGIVWTYLLAVLSFGRLTKFLGPKAWRVVRIVGMNYILFAFAYDLVPPAIYWGSRPYGVGRLVQYAPFAAMCVERLCLSSLLLRFATAAALINELVEAKHQQQLGRVLAR